MVVKGDSDEGGQFVPIVLIIDDEPEIREIYSLHLSKEFDVRTAANGDVPLAMMRDHIDIVFIDRHMPGISGDEFLRQMRANGLETPVVFISAVDAQESPDSLYQAYLSKPISGAEMKHHVEKYTYLEVTQSAESLIIC